MCEKTLRGCLTPATVKFAKITLLFVVFCFAECAAGSCISYGHSCWGGHGKRNGANGGTRTNELLQLKSADMSRNPDEGSLFYSRLIQGPRLPNNIREDGSSNSLDFVRSIQDQLDLTDDDARFPQQDDYYSPRQRAIDKIRFLNYLKPNIAAEKLN